MKLLLTSFGLGQNNNRWAESVKPKNLFTDMPPVNMQMIRRVFQPDYASLLLCDQTIMDEQSYRRLTQETPLGYDEIAVAYRVLNQEGYLELADFEGILQPFQPLARNMLEVDLENPKDWLGPLESSLHIWANFFELVITSADPAISDTIYQQIYRSAHVNNNRIGSTAAAIHLARKGKGAYLEDTIIPLLSEYLRYVNNNLILAYLLDCGLQDWMDYLPLYKQKFTKAAESAQEVGQKSQLLHQLFQVSFPEFAISNVQALIKILRDKRVAELRGLVQDAYDGKVEFDVDFARSVYREVFRTEVEIGRKRDWLSLASLPLDLVDLIPGTGLAIKAAEEVAGGVLAARERKKFRWFYLLNDVAGIANRRDQEGEV